MLVSYARERLKMQGAFRLLIFLSVSCAVPVGATAQPAVPSLELKKPVEATLDKKNSTHTYQLSLMEGEFVRFAVSSRNELISIELRSPTGNRWTQIELFGYIDANAPFWFVTETRGEYTLQISKQTSASSISYRLSLAERRTATETDKDEVSSVQLRIDGHRRRASLNNKTGAEKEQVIADTLDNYQHSLALSRKLDRPRSVIRSLHTIGEFYRSLGKITESFAYYEEALLLAESSKEITWAGHLAQEISSTYNLRTPARDIFKSRSYRERAVRYFTETGTMRQQIHWTMSLAGQLQNDFGDISLARVQYEKVGALIDSATEEEIPGAIFDVIAEVYSRQGNFGKATYYLNRAAEFHEKSEMPVNLAGTLIKFGTLYRRQGDCRTGRFYFSRGLQMYELALKRKQSEGTSEGGIATGSIELAKCMIDEGKPQSALQTLEAALKIAEKKKYKDLEAQALLVSGQAYFALGNLDRSLEFVSRNLSIIDTLPAKGNLTESLVQLGLIYLKRKEFSRAIDVARQGIAFSSRYGEFDERLKALEISGIAYNKTGDVPNARRAFSEYVELLENSVHHFLGQETSQAQFLDDKLGPYRGLFVFSVDDRNTDLAFKYAEKAKSRALVAALQNRPSDVELLLDNADRRSRAVLRTEMIELNSAILREKQSANPRLPLLDDLKLKLSSKRLEFDSQWNRLLAASPEIRKRSGNLDLISIDDAVSLIPERTGIVLQYVLHDERPYLLILDAAAKLAMKVIPLAKWNTDMSWQIDAIRSKFAAGDLDFQRASREFYDLFLKPAEKALAGKANVIIVPDGPLWDLPFQALMDENGKYLIEKVAVSYAPSLTALREMRNRANTRRPTVDAELLAFGNPMVGKHTKERVQRVFMSEKLEPIPEAERLVNSLAKMYGPNRSRVYTGAEAREEVAKTESPNYRIVQFATHGVINNVSPMYSHLVLAQNEKNPNEDGLLEAWELKDLNLKADMVILSACETARGKISNGEGMIGMTWASFIAGAPTTVASQWKVESTSTTELMLEFHRQLLAKQRVSKAEALRRASLKVMRDPRFRHPSYWAGFVLVGDGG